MRVYERARQLFENNWMTIPLVAGKKFPRSGWWYEHAKRGDYMLLNLHRWAECAGPNGEEPGLAVWLDENLGIIDIDIEEYVEIDSLPFDWLPQAPVIRTPSGGLSVLVRCPELVRFIKIETDGKLLAEVRPSGKRYRPIIGTVNNVGCYSIIRMLPEKPEQLPLIDLAQLHEFVKALAECFKRNYEGVVVKGFKQDKVKARREALSATTLDELRAKAGQFINFFEVLEYIRSSEAVVSYLFEKHNLAYPGLGKAICCPFHSEDNPSFSLDRNKKGYIVALDWHMKGTDASGENAELAFDVACLYHAFKTGELRRLTTQEWMQAYQELAAEVGLGRSPEELDSAYQKIDRILANNELFHGFSEADTNHIRTAWQKIRRIAIEHRGFGFECSTRHLASLSGMDCAKTSRILNLLTLTGILQKTGTFKRATLYNINTEVSEEQFSAVLQKLVQHGVKSLQLLNQNYVAGAIGGEQSAATFSRQSTAWEQENKMPAWREQFIPPSERGKYIFVRVSLEPKSQKPKVSRYIAQYINRPALGLTTQYPDSLPELPAGYYWEKLHNKKTDTTFYKLSRDFLNVSNDYIVLKENDGKLEWLVIEVIDNSFDFAPKGNRCPVCGKDVVIGQRTSNQHYCICLDCAMTLSPAGQAVSAA